MLFVLLGAGALALLVFNSRSSGLGSGGGGSMQDRRFLEQQTLHFLEDLQFKDFKKAASYHSAEDRKKVNIPALIERVFQVKPETLDIMRFEVERVDIDSSGMRARVKTHTVIKILNANEIKEPEIMFYWYKDPTEGWVMELESSLQ